jgi:hypothetical protein
MGTVIMKARLVFGCTLLLTAAAPVSAEITTRVKLACRSEYYAYCSAHAIPSPGLRSCMRGVKEKLSVGCVKALKGAGELTEAELREYQVRTGSAKQ